MRPVLDTGARGSTITFAQRGIGDVLIAWENDAFLALKEFGKDQFEIVTPSLSILAEPPVADRRRQRRRQRHAARSPKPISTFSIRRRRRRSSPRTTFVPSIPNSRRRTTWSNSPKIELITVDKSLRRLEEGASEAFRRRRHFRPDPETRAASDLPSLVGENARPLHGAERAFQASA